MPLKVEREDTGGAVRRGGCDAGVVWGESEPKQGCRVPLEH